MAKLAQSLAVLLLHLCICSAVPARPLFVPGVFSNSGVTKTESERLQPINDLATSSTCGDGKCEPPETIESCFADCPGVTTQPMCGEEPHADPQGNAVVDGRQNFKNSAAECCDACAAHAEKFPNKPCNSWVFCYMPICWSLDTGNTHTFGECWLKWQANPDHPLYGQRGKYSDEFRKRHWNAHKHNNLTVPTHVAWTGGVMGAKVDLSVTWETGADGGMRSSAGDTIVDYRPWESREENLKRGVKPEQMTF